jgi:uncharacterized protein YbgA (DUF1722 family)/uncharacterized protein YbbK (DUF523 family)
LKKPGKKKTLKYSSIFDEYFTQRGIDMEKIIIGISACLIGKKVRYDGSHKHDRYITDTLGRYFNFAPLCPEVEYGLPVPREPMRLTGVPEKPCLVTIHTKIDHTEGMKKWAEERLQELGKQELRGFIFKSRSPSSGMQRVKVYNEKGVPQMSGVGIFASVFMNRFPLVPVIDEGRLNDPGLREAFIEKVFVFDRWLEFLKKGGSTKDLLEFHTNHKLLMLTHSPKHATVLGRHIAGSKDYAGRLNNVYIETMMEGLRLLATTKKNTNVLSHIMGYFKKQLTADEKQELLEIIENYHKGSIPLIVPITMLNHYVRKYGEPYLKKQVYLNSSPLELMLRNHL